ncbi:hypothetical protein PQX77_022308, partial [Marasmius sp. AFHP31]
QRAQDFDRIAAVIHPFPPETESSLTPASNFRKAVDVSNPRMTEPKAGKQSIDLQQPGTKYGVGETSTHRDNNRPVDQASYQAMQAQIQLLMQKVERMEAVEEAPPEYVSAYGSR